MWLESSDFKLNAIREGNLPTPGKWRLIYWIMGGSIMFSLQRISHPSLALATRHTLDVLISLNPPPFPRKYLPLAQRKDQSIKAIATQSILLQHHSHLSWEQISNASSVGVLLARAPKCPEEHDLESLQPEVPEDTHMLTSWHNTTYGRVLPCSSQCPPAASAHLWEHLDPFPSPAAAGLPHRKDSNFSNPEWFCEPGSWSTCKEGERTSLLPLRPLC